MSPASCSRFTAALVCLALAVTPAAAQAVKADGTPVETSPAPSVKTDHTAHDAAVAAGVVAVGTALWLHHRQQVKKAAEAAAVAPPPPAPVESAAAAAPAPAPAPPPAPALAAEPPPPILAQAQPAPRPRPVHPPKSAVHRKPQPAPVAEPVVAAVLAPPVVKAPPIETPTAAPLAPAEPDNYRTLWMALGLVGALLLAAGALPRMLMAPPTFRARVRMKAPSVAAPLFSQAKVAAA